ncbi:MAG TPA: hypothetical protein VH394_26020 [Thermoanaerobaculia bacterium]|jgi:hypothetical protein|nr:hypothetical protein [Thermoanaerobaculia bacterium]
MRFPTRAGISTLLTGLALLAAAPAGAQFAQYTAPGSLLTRGTTKKEQLEKAAENARWHLGPFRLAPWAALRDAAYVSDVFAGTLEGEVPGTKAEPDFTITAGAGLQGYLPLGPKAFFTVEALPQYVYWQKHDERRRLNGYYGAGLFGFFNRLSLQAVARRAEEQTVLTPEFEQRIHSRQDVLDGSLELRLGHAFYLFGSASWLTFEPLIGDLGDDPRLPLFQDLNRDERVLRGGVELRPDDRVRVAVGVERSEVEFDGAARDRSNTGTSPILEASFQTERLSLSGALARRSLKPDPGSELVPFDDTTGHILATFIPRWRLSYSVYAGRDLTYSIDPGYSHFVADRLGGSIGAKLGRSSSMDVFYETGGHDYARTSAAVPARQDDFNAYGTTLHLQLGERVRWNLGVQRTQLEAPDRPGLDRSLTVFQSNLEFSAFGGAFTLR